MPQPATDAYLGRIVQAVRYWRPGVPIVLLGPSPFDSPYYPAAAGHAPAVAAATTGRRSWRTSRTAWAFSSSVYRRVVGFTDVQIAQMLKVVDTALSEMQDAATVLGAAKKQVDQQKDFTTSLMDSIDRGVGQLVDADMNKESTRLQALQVQQQLGIQALSRIRSSDPEAVVLATRVAMDFRTEFRKDVVIDVICFRRLGHNEQDTPSLTQPLMYKKIAQHPGTRKLYGDKLVAQGTIEERILALQERKAALADSMYSGSAARKEPLFNENDLAELLKPLG